MNPPQRSSFMYVASLVFLGAILYSTKAIFVKLAYRYEVPGISLLALRMLFALPLYLTALYLANTRRSTPPLALRRRDWAYVGLIGVTGYYVASITDFWGLRYVTASIERLILFTYPTLVLLFSVLFFRERIRSLQIIAILLTYAGIALTLSEELDWQQSADFVRGVGWVSLSALSFSLYILLGGRLIQKFGTLRFTVFVMLSAAVAILVHHYTIYGWQLFHFAPAVYGYAFLMGLLSTFVPSFLISEGLRQIGANNTAIISSIGPVSTIVLAYLFLGETLTQRQWLGTVLVIGGILVISTQKKPRVTD
ncbi:MAG: DMT family transporter [Bacteroidota bacterium]